MFFSEYDLLRQSGLFDAAYYLKAYPDVAKLNLDPLLHYLEKGASEGRNPHPEFDHEFYLEQCRLRGESAKNPLVHFLTVGAVRGFRPQRKQDSGKLYYAAISKINPPFVIHVESPQILDNVAMDAVAGSLSVNGWILARDGVASVDIELDDQQIAPAKFGIRREDVAEAFPGRADALHSGFAAVIPVWELAKGSHSVNVKVIDKSNTPATFGFRINVETSAEQGGPSQLRRKIPQAETDVKVRILKGLRWKPKFILRVLMGRGPAEFARLRDTLASVRDQVYENWRVAICSRGISRRVLEGFEDIADRVDLAQKGEIKASGSTLEFLLRAGDVLASDALLEFAVASGMMPDADFFYADERCRSPVTGSIEAFFKPDWSPDLLASTNYVGRIWCARSSLIKTAGLAAGGFDAGDYDSVLRATEHARGIHHIPKLLGEQGGQRDSGVLERRALSQAFRRRHVQGEIREGLLSGVYRTKRRSRNRGLVSIIIPTAGSRGLIRKCIESLRARTAYRNIEIICIDNVPKSDAELKEWLRAHADRVIARSDAFNWSRYNNDAAKRARGDFLLFLNDDVEAIQADWLDVMLDHAERKEVGAVGPLLLYPDRTVQHAGVALTDTVGSGAHLFRHNREDDPGYFGLALTQRNVIAVTGACLLTRREIFEKLGGFEEAHAVVNNDVDYCMRAWRSGLWNVYTPHAKLIHHEMMTRGELGDAYDSKSFAMAWRDAFLKGDPFFNPNLSRVHEDVRLEREPVREVYAGHPLFARERIRRILVAKLDHIGDCITAVPALRRLKQHFPSASITVLCASGTRMIWEMQEEVGSIVEFNFFHAQSGLGKRKIADAELRKLSERLQPLRFDLAVDLRKSSDARYVLQHTGARFLAGFDHQRKYPWLDVALEWEGDSGRTAKRQQVGDDLVNLVDAIAAASETDRHALRKTPPPLRMNPARRRLFAKPVVCIHPGAGADTRRWPAARFAELIDLLLADRSLHIALIGSANEAAAVRAVLAKVRQQDAVFDLVGDLELGELPSFLVRCALFVGNNSGPQHLAAGLGVPTIGVHSGVIDSREWGPMGPMALAIRRDMICSPCYISSRDECPRGMACLEQLSAGSVHRYADQLLAVREPALGTLSRPRAV